MDSFFLLHKFFIHLTQLEADALKDFVETTLKTWVLLVVGVYEILCHHLQWHGRGKKQSLDSLFLILQRGSSDSKIASARVLQFIAVDADAKISIAEKQGVVAELLKSAAPEKDPVLIEAALASLVAISVPKRNKLKLVNLGAVKAMKRLLKEANLGAAAVEKVLKENENGRVDDNENGKLRVEENFIDLGLSKLVQLKCATSVTESGKTMFSKTVKKNDVVKYF